MTSFLVVTTDYSSFRRWFRESRPELEEATYEEQLRARAETLFGLSDFYSSTLRELGHEAHDVVANFESLQRAWALEHGVRIPPWTRRSVGWSVVRKARTAIRGGANDWLLDVLAAQIRHHRPDVILNQSMGGVSGRFLRSLEGHFGLLLGQAEPMELDRDDVRRYDAVVSSLPSVVQALGSAGVPAFLLRHAFHPRALSASEPGEPVAVSFVGSLAAAHSGRIRLLEQVATQFPELRVWSAEAPASPILQERYEGPAWGSQMYGILARSRVTLNHHIDGLPYADNCRLFEATGMGTALLTDWKPNLDEMFEPGREVLAYRTVDECAELLGRYLEREDERAAVARSGQERTLAEHTFRSRMERLLEIVDGTARAVAV